MPLSFQEIAAWQDCMCRRLQPWEVRFIRRLSIEYVGEASVATEMTAPAPWSAPLDDLDRAAIASSMKSMIRSLA